MNRTACCLSLCLVLSLAGCDLFLSPDKRVARAEAQIAAHDYRSAMIELKNALQDEPDHAVARSRLAEVEFRLGDIFAAEKDLRRAFELGARSASNSELMAQIQLALGRGDKLLAQINAGELDVEGAARDVYRGQALLGRGQFESAQQAFDSVAASDPRANTAKVGGAEALAGQGKSEEALARLDALITAQPDFAPAWLSRGGIRAQRGEVAAAEGDLQHAQALGADALNPLQDLILLAVLTEVQLAQGKADAAAATQLELSKHAPESVPILMLAGRVAMAKQDYAEATAKLQRASALAPEAVAPRFLLGAALFAQGSPRQAEQQLVQVLQRAPENIEARKLLARIHLILGRPDAAMQVLLPAQRADDVQLDLLRGVARMQQGDETGGVADLERAAAARPGNENLQLDLAATYLMTDRADRAVELLQKIRRPTGLRHSGLLIAALVAAGDTRKAQAEVERLLRERPGDVEALTLAAGFFTQQRDFVQARKVAQRAVDLDPKNSKALLMRAAVASEGGELDVAREWLEKAVALDERDAVAKLAIAELDLRRGDIAAATKWLEDLRRRDPSAVEPRLRLVALYLRQRNARDMQSVVDELLALGKNQPEVQNSLGLLYLGAGRYDEALARFQDATAQDGVNPVYWLNTARAHFSLGRTSIAREALEKALATQPGWIPAVGTLAMLDLKEGREPAAMARVAELTTAHPRDTSALMLEGDVLMAAKSFARAAEVYAAAAAIRPSAALSLRSYRARLMGRLPNPESALEKWLTGHPGDHAVRLVLAEAYQASGDKRRAVSQYELMARGGGTSPIMLNNLAWLYYELGDPRAEATVRQAYDLVPKSSEIADTYGWILLERGKATDALAVLRQAAADTQNPMIQYHYAVALARTGSKEDARRRLTDILAATPGFPAAAEARKLLESL